MPLSWPQMGFSALALVSVAALGIGVYDLYGPDKEPSATKRWSNSPVVTETDEFTKAVNRKASRAGTGTDWRKPQLAVYSYPARAVRPPVPPGLKDLSDHGQAGFIDAVVSNITTADAVRTALAKPITVLGAESGRDPYRFDRVLVASVIKGIDSLPGDRLVWTRILIQPINFRFVGYSVAETINQSIKVAAVEETNGRKLSASLGVAAETGPKIEANTGADLEKSIQSNADINQQYEELSIDITPQFLRVYRESERGGDVAGNTLITLSAVTDPETIRGETIGASEERNLVLIGANPHLSSGTTLLKPEEASIEVRPQQMLPHCPLKARIWMLYEVRQITDKTRQNYDEGAQDVALTRDAQEQIRAAVVPADDVSPGVWRIRLANGDLLTAYAEGGQARPLVFTDYGTAADLAHWLRFQTPQNDKPDSANKYVPIGKADGQVRLVYPGNISLWPVKINDDECEADAGSGSGRRG